MSEILVCFCGHVEPVHMGACGLCSCPKFDLRRSREELRNEISRLKSENQKMREALEKLNFNDERITEFMLEVPTATVMSILRGLGDIVREALAEGKEGK